MIKNLKKNAISTIKSLLRAPYIFIHIVYIKFLISALDNGGGSL